MTDASPSLPAASVALDLARAALDRSPAGVLSDLDGTLAPIVVDPAAVTVPRAARAALARLADRLAVVGLITGRAARDARRIVGLEEILVVGNHGLEWLAPGEGEPRPLISPTAVRTLGTALERRLRRCAGLVGVDIERKGLSATVHYRAARDPAASRAAILAALGPPGDGIEVREGRLAVELRPAGVGDKGTALRAVVETFRLRGLLVVGDDLTDLDMFRAAAELRAGGDLRAAIVVVAGGGEVPAAVRAGADVELASPDAVAALLAGLVPSGA